MRKKSRRPKQLLLDKEIIKILSATDKVVGGAVLTHSFPMSNCTNTSQHYGTGC